MQGDFVWYELCTDDPAAAADFYSKVVGWTVQQSAVPEMNYTMLCIKDRPVAGVMTLPPEQMPPFPLWFGYIAVADVDAKAAELAAAGGNIFKPPQDIPQIGRFAVVNRSAKCGLHAVQTQRRTAAAARDDANGFNRLARAA